MSNPLLTVREAIPFDQIRAEHVVPAIEQLIAQAKERQRALAESAGERNFDNTMVALDRMSEGLDWAMGVVRHLESVATYPEMREAHNAVQGPVAEYYSQVPLDPGLWRVLQQYATTDEARALAGTRHRFLTKTIEAFRRHGAELDAEGKTKLNAIDIELTQLTTKFAENVLDSTYAFELVIEDEDRLAGLPESAREAAQESAKRKGIEGWRFTLHAPSYQPLMTYLDDRTIREQVWRAYLTRATDDQHDNSELTARILELRRAKAQLLGFRNFADFVLVERMAHTGEQAQRFIERLRERTAVRFQEENHELVKFAGAPVQPWDVAYYAEKQRRVLYDFDEEELRPYFALDRVVTGMFELVERLYGIKVVEAPGRPVWDPAVKTYRLDDADGSCLGYFYADWFPRENKRGGAWMDAFLTGLPQAEGWEPHVGLICGNLTPPVGDKPALLTHREVETIFHEFGHLLHHLLSRVEVRTLAGTNVAWDFVELPSQIMENWCWEREALDLFAAHWRTGERLPDDLFDKMLRARRFRAANAQMRQLGFATVDLALHIDYSPERDGSLVAYANGILQQFAPAPLPDESAMILSFTHLFASPVAYGAGYYSYKWAEVLDADAFTLFRREGIFSRRAGQRFREHILSKGDSEDPAELYRTFMGRDPDETALLERFGLTTA